MEGEMSFEENAIIKYGCDDQSVGAKAPVLDITSPASEVKPVVSIYLNYSPASHILNGIAIRDVYVDFRMNVLRKVDWAVWKGKLVKYPNVLTKGWTIRKNNLDELYEVLKKYEIPYTQINLADIGKPAKPIRVPKKSKGKKRVTLQKRPSMEKDITLFTAQTPELLESPIGSPNMMRNELPLVKTLGQSSSLEDDLVNAAKLDPPQVRQTPLRPYHPMEESPDLPKLMEIADSATNVTDTRVSAPADSLDTIPPRPFPIYVPPFLDDGTDLNEPNAPVLKLENNVSDQSYVKIMTCNNLPYIPGGHDESWKRIVELPFATKSPSNDDSSDETKLDLNEPNAPVLKLENNALAHVRENNRTILAERMASEFPDQRVGQYNHQKVNMSGLLDAGNNRAATLHNYEYQGKTGFLDKFDELKNSQPHSNANSSDESKSSDVSNY